MKLWAGIVAGLFFLLSLNLAIADETAEKNTLVTGHQAENSASSIGTSRVDSKFSLLDLNRISMQHSYSVIYSSFNGHGQTVGLYMNSLKYDISSSIDLNVTLGWVHQPGQMFNKQDRGVTDYGTILPNVQLKYQPSDKFRLMISYESIPGVYGNSRYNSYWPYSRFGY